MTLREFQQNLTDKVKVHQAGAEAGAQSLLGFESGGEYWLVDLTDAGEVLPVPALAGVPLTKSWFRGIANIRGTLYGVTDLAAFHGGEPTSIMVQTRLLLASKRASQPPGSNMALLMSGTEGLKALASLEILPPSDEMAPALPWRGKRYRDEEGRHWTHLLLPALLGASAFLDIAESIHGT